MSARQRLTARRTWLMPIVLIVGLAAVLPTVYLAATANPNGHLTGLPVGLVVEQQVGAGDNDVAESVASAIAMSPGDALTITRMTHDELALAMQEDQVAGAVVIPADFDASIASLMPGAAIVTVPTVTIMTNAGDGGLSNGLLVANLTPVLHQVAATLGGRLIQQADGTALPAVNAALLSEPFDISSRPYAPLPENAGMGTSAFYYSLILVLIAFIGASLIGPLVDSATGFIPGELGPLVIRQPYTEVSRRTTFIGKAAILLGATPLAALVLVLVATAIGVTASSPSLLWVYSTAVIAAIGTSALAVFAIFGPGIGSLINTIFFIALAMVSSGGVVPLEATPAFFQWFSTVAPFRHVVDGTRSILYFDGNLAAGLGNAWVSIAIGASIGIAAGLIVTTLYGRVSHFSRHPIEGQQPRNDSDDPIKSADEPGLTRST